MIKQRTIKVGDRVRINGIEGTVRAIEYLSGALVATVDMDDGRLYYRHATDLIPIG